MSYTVSLTPEAADNVERLYEFVVERALAAHGLPDFESAERALQAIKDGLATLRTSPFTCRKAGSSPFLRELVIPFGHSGYVALFEIVDAATVWIVAVRHLRESDYR